MFAQNVRVRRRAEARLRPAPPAPYHACSDPLTPPPKVPDQGRIYKQVVAPMKLAALWHLVRSGIAKARRVEGSELVGVCRSRSVRLWCDADGSQADGQSLSVVPFKLQVAGELGPFANLADAAGPFIDGRAFHSLRSP